MTTDTPLADAQDKRLANQSDFTSYMSMLDFARTLERDLAECRAALRGVMVALEVQRVDEALATLSAEQLAYIAGEVVKQAKEATQMRAALRELVVLDARPGIVSMNPIHRYHCPCTRHGSKFGPCDCDGDEAHGQIERAWSAARAILAKGEGK